MTNLDIRLLKNANLKASHYLKMGRFFVSRETLDIFVNGQIALFSLPFGTAML